MRSLADAVIAANEAEGEALEQKSAEETDAVAVGLTREELAAAREAYLRMWPSDDYERR